jgi:hypothetical protein
MNTPRRPLFASLLALLMPWRSQASEPPKVKPLAQRFNESSPDIRYAADRLVNDMSSSPFQSADPLVWARSFCATAEKVGYGKINEGWMLGWFASAMERGKIEQMNKTRDRYFRINPKCFAVIDQYIGKTDLLWSYWKDFQYDINDDGMFEELLVKIEDGRVEGFLFGDVYYPRADYA